ncbi:hypothetical protein HS1genome_1790 [Sulfodiicoccus acidiphilus]|uniref:Cytochrome P450 n=1 Tax=Sulfodiicoccus acidiphilus TaxID=1670455 RepID=A0A348B5E9_9CREN|nr:hypothetical protein [Sulfodiicoccus acidiphilus]BBD73401.1 hypothetical protein HS1genome_1790 [Sulfodiicoccus acidiphilus]
MEYDHLNPYPFYAYMRRNSPVIRDDMGNWQFFRYEDVRKILTDWSRFSSRFPMGDTVLSGTVLNLDPRGTTSSGPSWRTPSRPPTWSCWRVG